MIFVVNINVCQLVQLPELALGPVARLFSRHLYAVQNNVVCLSEQVSLSHNALSEIQFWIDNFAEIVATHVAFIPMY